jgi:3-hydroxyacyl-CoA dehydrogenase
MFYADALGLDKVLARIEEFSSLQGADFWTPAPLLRGLAEAGKTFGSFDQQKE